MSVNNDIPLVLVSGFLGAGKTTFLNTLFDGFPDRKFGIIVNDFGELGVDAAIIRQSSGHVVRELNNGQIFCSCLAGSFIKSVSEYKDLDIDYLLVETSGLAKPSPLLEIIDAVREMSEDSFSYHGMISLVDSETYLRLSGVLKAVDEQLEYSDIVLLNKIDRVDNETLKRVEMKILSVNPSIEIIRTEFGKTPGDILSDLGRKENITGPDKRYAGWGEQGRPVPLVLKNSVPVKLDNLRDFISNPGGEYYRMKGYLVSDEGPVFVDCTIGESKIEILPDRTDTEDGLVVILPADERGISEVKRRASGIFTGAI